MVGPQYVVRQANQFDSIQNAALRLALDAIRTSSNLSLYVETDDAPLLSQTNSDRWPPGNFDPMSITIPSSIVFAHSHDKTNRYDSQLHDPTTVDRPNSPVNWFNLRWTAVLRRHVRLYNWPYSSFNKFLELIPLQPPT